MRTFALIALAVAVQANMGEVPFDSSMSIDSLGQRYLQLAVQRTGNQFETGHQEVDGGEVAGTDNQQEGTVNQSTQDFEYNNEERLNSEASKTIRTYQTNRNVINNKNIMLERHNINNHVIQDHTNRVNKIHQVRNLNEIVNHNYKKIQPIINTYRTVNVRNQVNTDQQVSTDENVREENYDVEKLQPQHIVHDTRFNEEGGSVGGSFGGRTGINVNLAGGSFGGRVGSVNTGRTGGFNKVVTGTTGYNTGRVGSVVTGRTGGYNKVVTGNTGYNTGRVGVSTGFKTGRVGVSTGFKTGNVGVNTGSYVTGRTGVTGGYNKVVGGRVGVASGSYGMTHHKNVVSGSTSVTGGSFAHGNHHY